LFITGAKLNETDVITKVFALNSTYIIQRLINNKEKGGLRRNLSAIHLII